VSPEHGLDIVDNVAMTSRTDPSEKESFSTDSRRMTLLGVGTGVGTLPRQGLLPADSYRSQPRGRTFCRFPRHQGSAGQKGLRWGGPFCARSDTDRHHWSHLVMPRRQVAVPRSSPIAGPDGR
jgi:hypothetical protein